MKRQYIKPEIHFDSFVLADSIASGCQVSSNHEAGGCAVIIAGMPVFTDAVQACVWKGEDGRDGICYYVPSADNTVFGS